MIRVHFGQKEVKKNMEETEGKPKIIFGVDNLETAEEAAKRARANYIGTVVAARYPCHCELCQKGEDALRAMGETGELGDRLHIEVEPLTVRHKIQHIFANATTTVASKWGELNKAFDKLGLMKDLQEQGVGSLVGKTFEFDIREIPVGIQLRNSPQRTVVVDIPIRIVPPDEIEKLKSEQTNEPNYD